MADAPTQEQRFSIVAPDGEVGTVPASKLQDAYAAGFRPPTEEEYAKFSRAQQLKDVGVAGSFITNALSGATLGLSDWVLKNRGMVSPEYLQAQREANPIASGAGQIAGTIAGAGIGGTPAGLVAKAGGLVERGVAAATPSLGRTLAAGLSKGAGSAVEGAFFGGGQLLSEQALGDEELTAEKVLANVGLGAVVGGTLGGAMGVMGVVAPEFLRAAGQKTVKGIGGAASWARSKALGFGKSQAVAQVEAAAKSGAMTEVETQVALDYAEKAFADSPAGVEFRKAMAVTPEQRHVIQKNLQETIDSIKSATKMIHPQAMEARAAETASLLDYNVTPTDDAAGKIVDVITKAKNTLAMMRSNPEIYSAKGLVAKAEDIINTYEESWDRAHSLGDVFRMGDDTKRTLDKQVARWSRSPSPEAEDTVNAIRQIRGMLKEHLEDASVYGTAATRQAAYNSAAADFMDAEKAFAKEFGRKTLVRGRAGWEINDKKINRFLNQIGHARSADSDRVMSDYFSSAQKLLEQVDTSAANAGTVVDTAAGKAAIASAEEQKAAATQALKSMTFLRAMDPGFAFLGQLEKGMGVGGVPGGGFLRVINKIKQSTSAENILQTVAGAEAAAGSTAASAASLMAAEKASQATTRRVGAAIDAFFSGSAKVGSRFAAPASVSILRAASFGEAAPVTRVSNAEPSRKEKLRDYENRMAELTTLVSNPEGALQQMGDSVAGLHNAAPTVATLLQTKATAAARFLIDKAPKPPLSQNALNPFARPWQPSDLDLSKWQRYVAAVEDPVSVVEELRHGTISHEGIEVLRGLYPKLYGEVVQQATQKAMERQGKQVPYSKRLALGILLGVPTDESLSPKFVKTVQDAYASGPDPAEQQSGGGIVKSTQGGLGKLALADSAQTHNERMMAR